MVDRSKKMKDLGVTRIEPDLVSDDQSDTTLSLSNLTVDKGPNPVFEPSSIDVDATNVATDSSNNDIAISNEQLVLTVDGFKLATKNISLTKNQTKTITIDFSFLTRGNNKTVKVSGGNDSISTTIDIDLI